MVFKINYLLLNKVENAPLDLSKQKKSKDRKSKPFNKVNFFLHFRFFFKNGHF